MIRAVAALLAAALSLLAPMSASAQSWPTKPVRIVVAYPPGGATDLQARLVAAKLTERWGVPVIVENKPGGNTVIATDAVAKAAPDGHTVLLTAMPFALNPMLIAKLPYNTATDLVPVTLLATIPNVLVVYPGLPVNSLDDLIKLARAEPGSISFASTGQATSTHLSGELFAKMAGLRLNHIPYKGSAPAQVDLMAGRVSMMFDNGSLQLIKSGKLKAIAVTSAKRVPWLPNTPTMIEQGLAGYEAAAWYGVLAPGGTPAAIIQKLADDITWAVRSPDTVEKLTAAGAIAGGGSPEEFRNFLSVETDKWGQLVKGLGMKPE
ncbi:MAG: tripartite tricarboxylate transporter substrate binding protein [Betaproteobacteria bacterium]|nr:tripartite tricarboxylate transporter substrate binding protein [Betaproteobacteria bacterium]